MRLIHLTSPLLAHIGQPDQFGMVHKPMVVRRSVGVTTFSLHDLGPPQPVAVASAQVASRLSTFHVDFTP